MDPPQLPSSPQSKTLDLENPTQTLDLSDADHEDADEDHIESPSRPTPSSRRAPATTIRGRRTKKNKLNQRKLANIHKKAQELAQNLKVIPFVPPKTLDFAKHEHSLRKLGLWEFSQLELDRKVSCIRVDLLAKLIVGYVKKTRGSVFDDVKIMVNQADLARALNLPSKKELVALAEVVEVDWSKEFVGFVEDFVSCWMLLDEDPCIYPKEVMNWIGVIKDGHPEKVDYGKLIWFMVERELGKGAGLETCHYASHLQRLMCVQKKELFKETGEDDVNEVIVVNGDDDEVLDAEDDEMKVEGVSIVEREQKGDNAGVVGNAGECDIDSEGLVEIREKFVEIRETYEKAVEEKGMKKDVEVVESSDIAVDRVASPEKLEELVLSPEKVEELVPSPEKVEECTEITEKGGEDERVESPEKVVECVESTEKADERVESTEKGDERVESPEKVIEHVETMEMADVAMENVETIGDHVEDVVAAGDNEVNLDSASDHVDKLEASGELVEKTEIAGDLVENLVTAGYNVEDMNIVGDDVEDMKIDGCNVEDMKIGSDDVEDLRNEDDTDNLEDTEITGESGDDIDDSKIEEEEEEEEDDDDDDFDVEDDDDDEDDGQIHKMPGNDLMDFEQMRADDEHDLWNISRKDEDGIDEQDRYLRHCTMPNVELHLRDNNVQLQQVDDDEDEQVEGYNALQKFNSFNSLSSGHLMQAMEPSQIPYTASHFGNQSLELLSPRVDNNLVLGGPSSFFGNSIKRELDHDPEFIGHSLHDSNKRMRTEGPSWDQKPPDFSLCIEQAQHWIEKCRMAYQNTQEETGSHQQAIYNELEAKELTIQQLKMHIEDLQRSRQADLTRCDKELHTMISVVEDYRKALRSIQLKFSEYRKRCALPIEPLYKDAGEGGVVKTVAELEKERLKREEEEMLEEKERLADMRCIHRMAETFEAEAIKVSEGFLERLEMCRARVSNIEKDVELLRESKKQKQQNATEIVVCTDPAPTEAGSFCLICRQKEETQSSSRKKFSDFLTIHMA